MRPFLREIKCFEGEIFHKTTQSEPIWNNGIEFRSETFKRFSYQIWQPLVNKSLFQKAISAGYRRNRMHGSKLNALTFGAHINTIILSILILIFNLSLIHGQGTIRGKITDDQGEEIVGATIVLKSKPTVGTFTDLNGNFTLRIEDSSPQVILITYISYTTIEDEVNPKNGEVLIRNYTMLPATLNLESVVVSARAIRADESYMRLQRINSPISLDFISKETIRKTGDSQVDDAVKRITGVSTVGGYITVRGLADRYNRTTINGSRIPTLDPLTNNIKLDMFPTALVDNIVIKKSANPDLPGDWAGSYISIETNDYPDKLMVNIKTTFGYNQQSSFADVISTQRSPTDWLGFDNGFRNIQHFNKENFPYYSGLSSPYDEFNALGLGSFLDLYGITYENLPSPGGNANRYLYLNNMYYRLALVELGLLEPGLINSEADVRAAIDEYYTNPDLKDRAHLAINADAIAFNQSFPDKWITLNRRTTLDFSQNISIGNQISLFGNPLGFVVGFRYSTRMRSEPTGFLGDGMFSETPATFGQFLEETRIYRNQSEETNQWSALLNMAYNINPNNSISFMVMPNFTGINNALVDSIINLRIPDFVYEKTHGQLYEERKQIVYQFQSEHFIPGPEIKLEFNTSYTDGQSNTPDFRNYDYGLEVGSRLYRFKQADLPNRVSRYLNEDIFDTRFSLEFPFLSKPELPRKIKLGGAYLVNTLSNQQFNYVMSGAFHQGTRFESEEALVNHTSIETFSTMSDNLLVQYYQPHFRTTDFNKGESKVTAGFIMADLSLHPRIRLSGGLRVERTGIHSDVLSMFNKGIPPFHPDRESTFREITRAIFANPSKIKETNYLPSANLVYRVLNHDNVIMNARFGYSRTIGRPTIRETSSYFDFNYNLGRNVLGNPDLKIVNISNYDIRLEAFFASGDNISLSVFNKQFENHIELNNENDVFTWRNAPGISTATGIELEGRKRLFRNLEIMGNVTFVKSEAIMQEVLNNQVVDTISRQMQGQAPYIVNAMLTYSSDKHGIAATLSYNIQGPKLAFVTITQEQPDVFETPRHMFDFKISKNMGRHFDLELRVNDILNTRSRWAYYYDNNFNYEYEGTSWGTSYSFGVSYKL